MLAAETKSSAIPHETRKQQSIDGGVCPFAAYMVGQGAENEPNAVRNAE